MTVEEAIEAILFGRVRDLTVFDADHKAWPNVMFVPPTDSWLRIELLPNNGQRLFMAATDPSLYLGILQLTTVVPLNIGPATAQALAGQVALQFTPDLALYGTGLKVRIDRASDVGSAVREAAYWEVSVSVYYECFAEAAEVYDPSLDFTIAANSQYVPLI